MFIKISAKYIAKVKTINKYFHNLSIINGRHNGDGLKTPEEKKQQRHIIQKHLDISYQRAISLLQKNTFLQDLDNNRLNDTLKSLRKMGLENNDIYKFPLCLTLHSNTVEHNVLYLKEAGFVSYISAQTLLGFRSIVKKPISLLKAHGVILEETNVPEKLYSYLEPKPNEFSLLDKLTDEYSLIHIHEVILKEYLVWRLNATVTDIERIFEIYDNFKYKSFSLITQMIQILTEDLKFSTERILKHGYLFQINPKYPKQVVTSFPTLAGIDVKKILKRYPKIITISSESILTINTYLKNFGISDEAIQKCFDIYTLNPNTVLHRLEEIKRIPEFDVLSNNKRIVRLVLCQNKAKLRLEHLQKLKIKCSSINALCSTDSLFEKFTIDGNDRTRGFDILNFLSIELNITIQQVRHLISLNPNWSQISLIRIQDTLNYLLFKNFTKDDIKKMPVILLYPSCKIKETLGKIKRHPELHEFILNMSLTLNLCLYFLEKNHRFSGDGIWDKEIPEKLITNNENNLEENISNEQSEITL